MVGVYVVVIEAFYGGEEGVGHGLGCVGVYDQHSDGVHGLSGGIKKGLVGSFSDEGNSTELHFELPGPKLF